MRIKQSAFSVESWTICCVIGCCVGRFLAVIDWISDRESVQMQHFDTDFWIVSRVACNIAVSSVERIEYRDGKRCWTRMVPSSTTAHPAVVSVLEPSVKYVGGFRSLFQ